MNKLIMDNNMSNVIEIKNSADERKDCLNSLFEKSFCVMFFKCYDHETVQPASRGIWGHDRDIMFHL